MADKIGNVYIEQTAAVAIAVGDTDSFKPKLQFKKWNDECKFSVELDTKGETGPDSYDSAKSKILWTGKDITAEFFPLDTADGYEFNVIFKTAPASNILSFIISAENAVFYPQPFVSEMIGQKGIVTATETDGFDKDGKLIVHSPENIVKSYAVYHAAPPKNIAGGPDYKSGKIGHIYRPKATDSKGDSVWCELNISGSSMTITVPQKFLDSAIFPVIVDPTFGYTTIGGSSVVYNAPGSLCHIGAGLVYSPSGQHSRAIKFSVYGSNDGTVGSIQFALYNISGGVPVNRVAAAVTISLSSGVAAWLDSSAIAQTLMNGSTYGLAEGASVHATVYFDTGAGNQRSHCATNLPATWTDDGITAVLYSWYATYEQCQEAVV